MKNKNSSCAFSGSAIVFKKVTVFVLQCFQKNLTFMTNCLFRNVLQHATVFTNAVKCLCLFAK